MPKVHVDRSTCEGYGNCAAALPGIFDLDEDGLVVLDDDAAESASLDDLRRVAYDCPTSSITVSE
jgi:ferredoxin